MSLATLSTFGVLGIVLGPVVFAIAAAIIDVLSGRTVMPVADAGNAAQVGTPEAERPRHLRSSG
jgi:predicted PurR-regulated permease PerM